MKEHDEGFPTRLTTKRKNGSNRVQHVNVGESKTHQSFKDEVDVTKIVTRHRDTRLPLPSTGLVYADVSELTDYRDALDNVKAVEGIFMKLPSASRAYFDNDPARFLDWTFQNDAESIDGLVRGPPKPPEEPAPPVAAVPPAAPEVPPEVPPVVPPVVDGVT